MRIRNNDIIDLKTLSSEPRKGSKDLTRMWQAETRLSTLMSKHPATPVALGLRLESARLKLQRIIVRFRSEATTNTAKATALPTTMEPSRKTTFFDLPAELRNVIYATAATTSTPLTLLSKPGSTPPPALLLTSQQCRAEFLPILLATANLHVFITDMNFTKLIAALSRLRPSERNALARNQNLLVVLRIKKCGSEVYANLRAWCQFLVEISFADMLLSGSDGNDQFSSISITPLSASASATTSPPLWQWHYTIPRTPPTNPAQLDWYCGRARILAERSSGDERVRGEVERVLEVLDGERTGKAELGSWNMGFGDAYALYVAGAARRG